MFGKFDVGTVNRYRNRKKLQLNIVTKTKVEKINKKNTEQVRES